MATDDRHHEEMIGFWQVLVAADLEETHSFRETTTTERAGGAGFTVYTRSHFMDVRVLSMRTPPAEHPPTDEELASMYGSIRAAAGRCEWTRIDGGWVVEHDPIAESHPGAAPGSRSTSVDGSRAVARAADADSEHWRRLSGPGATPLSGVWQSGKPSDRWVYLATEGHYGLLHTDLTVPPSPRSFSFNVGARLETGSGFDHWPMVGPVYGYDVRKHESFLLELVDQDRFVASIPTFPFPAAEWTRLE